MISIAAKPFKDEILSSWIIRSALASGSDPLGWSYGLWGEWRGWTRDIDRYLSKEKLIRFARVSGIPLSKLYSMTLAPTVAYLSEKTSLPYKVKWNWVIPLGSRNRSRSNGLHFCPVCLAEKVPYLKKEWRLSWSTLCPKHHIQLLLHCPQCHQIFSPHRIDYKIPIVYLCSRCSFDLRKSEQVPAHTSMISFHKILQEGAFEHTAIQNKFTYSFSMQSTIEVFWFIRDCMRLLHNLQRQKKRYVELLSHIAPDMKAILFEAKAGVDVDALKNAQRYYILHIVLTILSMDSFTFITFLKKSGITKNTLQNTIGSPNSASMKNVMNQLPSNSRKLTHPSSSKEIEPLSAEEVEKLMDEIRQYL